MRLERSVLPGSCRLKRAWIVCALATLGCMAAAADEPSSGSPREALADAWWTGPLLAPSASTLPRGHALAETYVNDAITDGRFDRNGNRHASVGEHDMGSSAYLLYGITDRVSVGLLPRFGFNEPLSAPNSTAPGIGDFSAQLQYGLTSFHEGSWLPATAVVLGETFPTGRYDHLQRASDGLGAGVYTTALSWYSQDYLWLRTGRILRVRLDLTYAVSNGASVQDASVYGTGPDFRGRAYPGDGFTADGAAEYSVTRNWVVATDLIYQHNGGTRVTGSDSSASGTSGFVNLRSGSSEYFGVAPAIEFSWSARAGIIVGARIIAVGRNTTASITPTAAINLVF
jgi:hypothetical protein